MDISKAKEGELRGRYMNYWIKKIIKRKKALIIKGRRIRMPMWKKSERQKRRKRRIAKARK
jgi:hypothetical protein